MIRSLHDSRQILAENLPMGILFQNKRSWRLQDFQITAKWKRRYDKLKWYEIHVNKWHYKTFLTLFKRLKHWWSFVSNVLLGLGVKQMNQIKKNSKKKEKKTTFSKNRIQKNNGENKGSKTKLYSGSNRWRRKWVW